MLQNTTSKYRWCSYCCISEPVGYRGLFLLWRLSARLHLQHFDVFLSTVINLPLFTPVFRKQHNNHPQNLPAYLEISSHATLPCSVNLALPALCNIYTLELVQFISVSNQWCKSTKTSVKTTPSSWPPWCDRPKLTETELLACWMSCGCFRTMSTPTLPQYCWPIGWAAHPDISLASI